MQVQTLLSFLPAVVFPSLFRNHFRIHSRNGARFEVKLIDASGKYIRIAPRNKFSHMVEFDTSDLSVGIYFVEVRQEDGFFVEKVLKY